MRNANGIVISIIFHVRKGEKKDATTETTVVHPLSITISKLRSISFASDGIEIAWQSRSDTDIRETRDDGDPSRILVRSDISIRARAFILSFSYSRTYVRTCVREEKEQSGI